MMTMMNCKPGCREKECGFTLAELLIAITLLGLIMVLAFSGIRLAVNSWDKVEAVSGSIDESRLVHSFIRRQLEQTRSVFFKDEDESRLAFLGESDRVRFVAPVPVQHERLAGLYLYTLQFVGRARERRLELSYTIYFPDMDHFFAPEQSDSIILVDDIDDGEFAYFGSQRGTEEARWHERWDNEYTLPELVKFRFSKSNGSVDWPELVIPIKSRRVK
jgi:general secretion pathway protein J